MLLTRFVGFVWFVYCVVFSGFVGFVWLFGCLFHLLVSFCSVVLFSLDVWSGLCSIHLLAMLSFVLFVVCVLLDLCLLCVCVSLWGHLVRNSAAMQKLKDNAAQTQADAKAAADKAAASRQTATSVAKQAREAMATAHGAAASAHANPWQRTGGQTAWEDFNFSPSP